MREVDELEDAVNEGQADGAQSVDGALGQPVQPGLCHVVDAVPRHQDRHEQRDHQNRRSLRIARREPDRLSASKPLDERFAEGVSSGPRLHRRHYSAVVSGLPTAA